MKFYSRISSLLTLVVCLLLALSLAPSARAQTPSILNPPYNNDLGAVVINSARTAGTVTSEQQSNLNWKGVTCTYHETVSSGSPSTTFSIQEYETATNLYRTLATSGAVATNVSAQTVSVYPGIQTSSLPSAHVGLSWHLPRFWRVSQTIAGSTGPATTGNLACNYLN